MKVEISKLKGSALDWAVAQILRLEPKIVPANPYKSDAGYFIQTRNTIGSPVFYSPSILWAQGGPLLYEHLIAVTPRYTDGPNSKILFDAECHKAYENAGWSTGETYLSAGMKCLIASKKNDFINVPDELCKELI